MPLSGKKNDRVAITKSIVDANLFKAIDDTSARPHEDSSAFFAGSLKLVGTLAGTNDTPSYAIIEQSGQPQKLYRAGDQIGGGITVEKIYADHVFLSRGKSQATLYLKYP